jgi:photosystem II stability/assembly factor-like uncharacterized protein
MKKLIFLLAAVLLSSSQLYSQWVQQPAPTTNSIEYIHFFNSSSGFIAGGNGLIAKTTNGSTNWVTQTTPTTLSIEYIYFFDMNTAIAVCGDYSNSTCAILKTTNGGTNWVTKFTNTHIALRQTIQFINPSTGYTAGWSSDSALVKTTNGGETWQRVYVNGAVGIDKINFIDANTGYMAGYGMDSKPSVLKTTNGGLNWTKIYSHLNAIMFMSMYFVNVNTGWVVGISPSNQSLIQKTTNAGLNWVDQVNQHPANWELYNIQMLNENTGWIIGDVGQIVKTTNGGVNWRAQNSIALPLWGIEFNGADTGWVVGYNGLILKTVNGGGTVSVQNISSDVPSAYSLKQNYPNPFNNTSNLKFQILNLSDVKIIVYDIMGREVQMLVNERMQPGTYETTFNGSNLSSGIYFYKLSVSAPDGSGQVFTDTKRLTLLK